MQIHISSRHLKLTGAMQAFVTEKISHLEHIADDVIGAHVVLMHDETKTPAKAFTVKAHIGVPGPDVHVEEHASDLYGCVDLVLNKLERQMRKRKTRLKETKKHKLQKKVEREKKYGKN